MSRIQLFAILAVLGFSAAAAETGYPHANEPIGTARQVYDGALMPGIQVNTFRNIDRLFSTRVVKRGSRVYPLPRREKPLHNLIIRSGDNDYDLYEYVSQNRVSGLLAIKDGEIVYEQYELGNNDKSRWMSMSVVKSITAMLVGAAIKDGHIESVDDAVTNYVTELSGSAYEGVSIRHLLQMASGVEWNETYTDPKSDRRELLEAQIAQEPGGMLEVMSELPRAAEPGTRWNYSTGETQVVAELLSAATGRSLADYLSEKIWAGFGMESNASWWLESPDGLEVGGSGLSATLRDYGRFGLFLLNGGVAGGEQVLPDGWIEEASRPQRIGGTLVDYGYMMWPMPNSSGTIHDGAYEGRGLFGQRLYVNPTENVVIAIFSARAKPVGTTPIPDHDFYAALCETVR